MPQISVVIPSFSRPDFLQRSMESVIAQTFVDWEMIIVDDNGRGTAAQLETERAVSNFQSDPRVRYLVMEVNSGGSAARNLGWKNANGKYLCFLDNDDEFYPEKLEFQHALLSNSGFQATACRFDSFKKNEKVRTSPPIPALEDYLIPFVQGKINFASGSTLMISAELIQKIGGFDEKFRRKQDVELMVRILTSAKLAVDNRILVRLHIDDRANIPNLEKFKKTQDLFDEKFLELFRSFSKRDQDEIAQYKLIELAKVALWNKDYKEFMRIFVDQNLGWKNKVSLSMDLFGKFITYYIR